MNRVPYLYFLVGALIFLILHVYFFITWDTLYAHHPWRGSAQAGPAFFSSSPRSAMIAGVVLFAAALGLTLVPTGHGRGTGAALWAGVMSAVVLVWVATARFRQESNMWPIVFVSLSFMTGVPMLVGRIIGLVYWRIRIGLRLNPWFVVATIALLVIVGMEYWEVPRLWLPVRK
jgi:hypothetical protein